MTRHTAVLYWRVVLFYLLLKITFVLFRDMGWLLNALFLFLLLLFDEQLK